MADTSTPVILDSADFADLAELRRALEVHEQARRSSLLLIDAAELEPLKLQIEHSPRVDFLLKPHGADVLAARLAKLERMASALDAAESAASSLRRELDRIGYQDRVTGLPSSEFFERHLTYEIRHAQRYSRQLAVLALDCRPVDAQPGLDGSQRERLLGAVAERLVQELRNHDVVGRTTNIVAGDRSEPRGPGWRFLIALSEHRRLKDVTGIVNRLLEAASSPFDIDGAPVHIEARIGISVFPGDGESEEALIRNAHSAIAHVNGPGFSGYAFFAESTNRLIADRAAVEGRLRRAIEGGAFHLLYQPRVALDTGNTTGLEALVRWQDAELGSIPPGKFIPLAEELDLIGEITRWVLKEACRQCRSWLDAGMSPVPIAINLSSRDYLRSDFPDFLSGVLLDSDVAPKHLELEITESLLPEHPATAIAVLEELRKIGVGITLDGFGNDSSLLGQLHRLPIDIVKIDRSFVRSITDDWSSAAVTAGVINLAQSLKLRVVAEGVETAEQVELLKDQNCNEVQGAAYSMPLSPEDAARWLGAGGKAA